DASKRVHIGWDKEKKNNNAASTLTYNQPAGSVSILFAKPTFGKKSNNVPLNSSTNKHFSKLYSKINLRVATTE
ncbi:unnamed protein product, partial [Brassica rapa subsp. trilocularis]